MNFVDLHVCAHTPHSGMMRQLLPGAAMPQTDVATANPPTLVNCAACFVMGKLPAVN